MVRDASKCAVYARFSSHNQREESIEDQVRACAESASRSGQEVVAVYADHARSGTSDARPEFRRMVEEARSAEWATLWVYKADRFARNRYDAAVYKRRLQKCGVAVAYSAQPVPDGPMGAVMESVMEGMAEYYSLNLSEDVKRGLHGNAAKCHPNGVYRFGWRIAGAGVGEDGKWHAGDRYEVVPEEAEAVRLMYRMRASGKSFAAIAERVAGTGVANSRGVPLSAAVVARILRDEAYMGVYRYGCVRVEGGIPAIVTEAQWRRAQRGTEPPRTYRKWPRVEVGARFGELEVVERLGPKGGTNGNIRWLVRCSCGTVKAEWGQRLATGRATHCGCMGDGRPRDEKGMFRAL